jgi:hypothetical protein
MITIENQNQLLLTIARNLKKPITVYAVGGTAMMFLGLKDATLDIDLVFTTEEDRKTFIDAITTIGYKTYNSITVYGAKRNQPKMYSLGNERFDLFLNEVIDFVFSENMQKRCAQVHEYERTLKLCIAHHQDIVLMKCATDRAKDLDDARKIIETKGIDYESLIAEAATQVTHGRTEVYFDLGEFLEKLKGTGVNIPQDILNRLYDLSIKELEKKKKQDKKDI